MEKMSEMSQTIADLHSAAADINDAANCLYQQFSGEDETPLYKWADKILKPTTDLIFAGNRNFLCGE